MYLPVDVSFGCARCGMRQHWLAVTGRAATAYGGELWNRVESRIEMHLESTCDQCVNIRAAQLSIQFAAFETIHTESSFNFSQKRLGALLDDAGFNDQADVDGSATVVCGYARGPSVIAGDRKRGQPT